MHGIAYFDGKLWVTGSFDNLVAVYDPGARRWTKWYPAVDLRARNRDVHHFNTIISERDTICILAHNNGPGDLMYYDRSSLDLCGARRLGCQSHDIFPVGDGIGTCSSADGMLVSSTGWTLRTGAFPRGVAFGKDAILVGLSQIARRSVRHETSGFIRRFTTNWITPPIIFFPAPGWFWLFWERISTAAASPAGSLTKRSASIADTIPWSQETGTVPAQVAAEYSRRSGIRTKRRIAGRPPGNLAWRSS